MTALNSEGLLPCPFCGSKNVAQGASRDMISVWCFCGAQGPSVPFPEINPEPTVAIHKCFAAWNRRALPTVDGLEVVAELNRIIAEEAADFADAAGHAVEAGERPDLWDREVEVAVHTLSQASSVIAGLTKERDEVAELAGKTIAAANAAVEAAEARISSLEEEIKRLREIVKAVAHIGVDFGFGPYELEAHFIEDARQALEDHNG